jgi:hypothetical protein
MRLNERMSKLERLAAASDWARCQHCFGFPVALIDSGVLDEHSRSMLTEDQRCRWCGTEARETLTLVTFAGGAA